MYKEIIKKSFIWGLVFAITAFWVVYAANITSVKTQSINSWDIMGKGWFQDVNDSIVPSWAVMAFNKSSCPTGWSEYTPAYGRFIRWIDKSWNNQDPDGERSTWNIQSDMIKSHSHTTTIMIWDNSVDWVDSTTTNSWEHHNESRETASTWWAETRPVNVALLYCEKN